MPYIYFYTTQFRHTVNDDTTSNMMTNLGLYHHLNEKMEIGFKQFINIYFFARARFISVVINNIHFPNEQCLLSFPINQNNVGHIYFSVTSKKGPN